MLCFWFHKKSADPRITYFTEILLAVIEYHLRIIRTAENKSEMPNIKHVEVFVNLDSIKYTIQLIIKYGKQKLPENEDVNI